MGGINRKTHEMRVRLRPVFFPILLWLIKAASGGTAANNRLVNYGAKNYFFYPLLERISGEDWFRCLMTRPEKNPSFTGFCLFQVEFEFTLASGGNLYNWGGYALRKCSFALYRKNTLLIGIPSEEPKTVERFLTVPFKKVAA